MHSPPRASLKRLSPCDRREPLHSPHVIDDIEDARVQPRVLDAELLAQAAPVDKVVAGLLAPALAGKVDLSLGEEPAHDVRQLTEADRDPTRVVEMMAGRLGQ